MTSVSIEDVYITGELARRPPKPSDAEHERSALREIVSTMADDPGAVLPRFVDLTMSLTGGISAGLSLFEPDPKPGIFRWHHLRGTLAPFEGATTPREFSPCGVTLDAASPTLSTHPERVYDWIAAHDLTIPEVLLVPLYVGGAEQLGTLWIVAENEGHFDSGHARIATEMAAYVSVALRVQRNHEATKKELEDQRVLAEEMSHRVKNYFSLTDGMIRMTAKGSLTKEEMAKALSGRIHALADAHSLARRSPGNLSGDGASAALESLIKIVVQPHENHGAGQPSKLEVKGPFVACGEHSLNALSLVFHELATNAAKYGSLSNADGIVRTEWDIASDRLALTWTERNGPMIDQPPTRQGLGGKLVHDIIARQFGGSAEFDWRSTGLVVKVDIPAQALRY